MKYRMNYQFLLKGDTRPDDNGPTVRVEAGPEGFALLPVVGDYVQLDNSVNNMESIAGRVKSRYFSYLQGKDEDSDLDSCIINIVLEEDDSDWGALIKPEM